MPIFSVNLHIKHSKLDKIVRHVDRRAARSVTDFLKDTSLSGKRQCDLKNKGSTEWTDKYGALHILTIEEEKPVDAGETTRQEA